jgi:spoIIIJ-associated protein
VAHAEASARTVDAAVTAAAAQLGLHSDQVNVEVLEDPVPSTFGYIGSPARVRVTARSGAPAGTTGHEPSAGHPDSGPTSSGAADMGPTNGPYVPVPTDAAAGAAGPALAASRDGEPAPLPAANLTGPDRSGAAPQDSASGSDGTQHPPAPGASGDPPTTAPPSTLGIPDTTGDPEAQPAPSPVGTGAAASSTEAGGGAADSPKPPTVPSLSSETKPSRRIYRDEPIDPQMVEVDTERAGDFLEGLLDALDVDGDITTWIDEVGGHIDLEGSDLNVLVGSNGETLDALQELTRLAVLRQSKRRVRLLLDINGFRARQREQLISVVNTTVEQVIRTREEHVFQPMTPAERKVVHDAVAAIDGVSTESLGEEPNRRVVIRPT